MEETITSEFYKSNFTKAIGGGIFFLIYAGSWLYDGLTGGFVSEGANIFALILLICFLYGCYFCSESWKKITVNATGITVNYIILRKIITISYDEIIGINIYKSSGGRVADFSKNFVISLKGDQSVSFSDLWYENYNKLTLAIYHYKYGDGHGRERYLERHGG